MQGILDEFMEEAIYDIQANGNFTFATTPTATIVKTSDDVVLHLRSNYSKTEWLPLTLTGLKYVFDLGSFKFDYVYH